MGTPPESFIRQVRDAYERGLTLDAFHLAAGFAPLEEWEGTSNRCLAARIAANAGGLRLATRLAARMWRADKDHPLSQFEYGFQVLQARGPVAFWITSRSWGPPHNMNPEWSADLLALKGRVASDLRDFTTADELIGQACALSPRLPWVQLQRAYLAERMEKLEEALDIASNACRLHPHPFYRPGVQTVAHLLQSLGRDQEAIDLLWQADAALQNCHLATQLHSMLVNTEQWSEAEKALDRYEQLSPLIEIAAKNWLRSGRAQIAHMRGQRAIAFEFARSVEDSFHKHFAQKLLAPAVEHEQARLPVPFVRQHFKTCAPATMAAIGRYWRIPAEHLAVAESICYDGTPFWQQREWAESNDCVVREFRVTWESACDLIDRQIPFAIGTVEAASAHMQAVMGFDRARGTLLLREPSQPYSLEADAARFLERYRPFGPHGIVFVPKAQSTRLENLSLPDCKLFDELHQLRLALSKHDRPKAVTALAQLESRWPDHEITWEARLDLATYDANSAGEIRCLDRLLELFPGTPARLLRRLACMREASREERIEFLNQACANKPADPLLFVELARHLLADAQCLDAAGRWLQRALRRRVADANILSALADLRWRAGRFEEGTELYRFAATLEGYREAPYQAWFVACRQVRQTPAALAQLEDRFQRLKARSSQPGMTLAWALRELEQPQKARDVLEDARKERPDEGYLTLRAASLEARLGEFQKADELLQLVRGKVRESDWLRTGAEIAESRHAFADLMRFAQAILELEPLALDAHAAMARAVAKLEGPPAAVVLLKEACARHPHHFGLRRLHIEWSRQIGPQAVAMAARGALAISARDAWTHRELATALANLGRLDEALAEVKAAGQIEPRSSGNAALLGHVYERQKEFASARNSFRDAIALNVDNTHAIYALLRLAKSDTERKAELLVVEKELVRQVVRGDGLLAFLEVARPLIAGEALLSILRQAHADRPDLWHAWSALAMQLDHLGRAGEALPIAREATERFPHLPRLWMDLANLHRHRGQVGEELAAAERAFEINPAWNRSAIVLAGALERHRSLDEAGIIYERALSHTPDDAHLLVQLASVHWRQRRASDALVGVQRALRASSDADWAWNLLINWSRECGQTDLPADFARKLTAERPGDFQTWLMLARVLNKVEHLQERLAAVDRARALSPAAWEPLDLKAELLAQASQFDAATQTCIEGLQAGVANAFMLQGRRAWIEAQRNRLPDAIEAMRTVLSENSGYAWGWQQLAAWLTKADRLGEAQDAMDRLLELQPQNLSAKRQSAGLRLRRGDRKGAERILSGIFDSAPTDAYSADQLFNLQLEIGNLEGAASTLQRLHIHQPGAHTLARQVMLDTRRSQEPAALETFKTLCCLPDLDPWPVQAATDALEKSGWAIGALEILRECVSSDSCNPQAGAAAAQLMMRRGQNSAAVGLLDKIRSTETQTRAATVLARELGKRKAASAIRTLIRRHKELLLRDNSTWAEVGYALTTLGRMRAAVDWFDDWRSRPNVSNSTLFNYCFALRSLGHFEQAAEVAQFAVSQPGYRGDASADIRLFIAVENALAGSLEAAAEDLRCVHVRKNHLFDQRLRTIASTLVEFLSAPVESRRQVFKDARNRLNKLFPTSKMPGLGSDMRTTFRRAGEVFSGNGVGSGGQFWFFWKLNWHWTLIPLALVLLVVPIACQSTPALYPGILAGSVVALSGLARRRKST